VERRCTDEGEEVSIFEHYVFSRINCEYPVDPSYPDRLYQKVAESRFNLEWLGERCDFLEKWTLPSILSQTATDFKWILLANIGTPNEIKKRLESYPGCTVEYTDESPRVFVPKFLKKTVTTPWVMTTTLDSDDAISMDFIETVQASFNSEHEYLNLTKGYKYLTRTDKFYSRFSHGNPFITLVEPTDGAIGVYCRVHGSKDLPAPIRQIGGSQKYWLQVVHGDNIVNKGRLMSKDKGHPYSDISDRFKVNLDG